MEFAALIDDLLYDAAFWMTGLDDDTYPIEDLGQASGEVSQKLRTLAIAMLLSEGDTTIFCHNLIRSGLARLTFQRRCADERRVDDYHRVASRCDPFIDTVAAGDLDLARLIAALSPDEWWPEHEYEDDFCYALFLHRAIQVDAMSQDFKPLILQFENSLEGAESARLDVCRALISGEQQEFDDAFAGMLEEHEARIEEDKSRGAMEHVHALARRAIFVEGLALLRVAESLSFRTDPEYRYCPELARLPMTEPFPADDPIWPRESQE